VSRCDPGPASLTHALDVEKNARDLDREDDLKGSISRKQDWVRLELDMREWSYLKSIIVFARKAANGPLFATDGESPQIERMARAILDEIEFERAD
jgi:hypothetical protein